MRRGLLLCAALLLSPDLLHAQDATSTIDAAERGAVDPLLKSTARSTAPAIILEFGTEQLTARAQIGAGMGSLSRWGLTLSGPVAGQGKRTTLATGEGLANGTSAEFLLRFTTDPSNPDFTQAQFQAICDSHVRQSRQAVVRSTRTCTRTDLTPAGKHLLDVRAFRDVWTFGGSIKVGRTSFAYAEPVLFGDESVTHDGWSASASIGRFQGGRVASALYYVGASYRHENAYVGADPSNVCTPVASSSSFVCRDVVIGAPSRRKSDLLQVEARSFPVSSVGLAPRVSYEGNSREWAVEMPLYLRQEDGPFSGGVSFGWDSGSENIQISVFVGALPAIFR